MKLYNTLTRAIEEFEPIDSENVGMYTCGPTVYGHIHIGNFRTYITSDILRRVLVYAGFNTKYIMNITDVGHMRFSSTAGKVIDPVLEEAKQHNITPLVVAQKYTDLFLKDSKRLNIIPADVYPKASEHIADMIDMIEVLIEKKYAYKIKGDVYFDVKKFKDYGKLSGNTLDKMDDLLKAVRESVETDKDKKDSIDFALWKAQGDRVLGWNSPWGMGVPGWHIECSAMSIKYLGLQFDIHAGGEDLIFPHHEDEIAQAEACIGKKWVNYWVHSTYLTVEGEKMSRSKGNIYTLDDLEAKGFNPMSFRYLTYLTHYSTRMNMTWEGLEAAQIALDKLYEQVSGLGTEVGEIDSKLENEFYKAVTNNLNMPAAIATVWKILKSGKAGAVKFATILKIDEVLGLDIRQKAEKLRDVPPEIIALAAERVKLRKMKKFGQADQLRAKIEKRGFIVKDEEKKTKILRKLT